MGTNKTTAYQHKCLIRTIKHGGGGVIIWACFAAAGPGRILQSLSQPQIPLYTTVFVNCEAICSTAKARLIWAGQQIYIEMTEKEKNSAVAVAGLKS